MTHRTHSHRSFGFTLVEMAIVIIIIALVIGFAVTLGTNAVQAAQRTSTQERLATIKMALESYQRANGYLPCPASRALTPSGSIVFGVEARSGASCDTSPPALVQVGTPYTGSYIGAVPVRTLGLPDAFAADAWGNKLLYAVGVQMVNHVTDAALTDPGITIMRGDPSGTNYSLTTSTDRTIVPTTTLSQTPNMSAPDTPAAGASYVVLSHGPDGRGAYPLNGNTVQIPCGFGAQIDGANCDDSDSIFYDTTYNDGVNEQLFFDDYIVWGSNALQHAAINPMVASCPIGCEQWCAPCSGTVPNLPVSPTTMTSPVLCQKIITSISPCAATCLWSGTVTADGSIVKCP